MKNVLQYIFEVVNGLSPEELHQLRAYIDRRQGQVRPALDMPPEERVRRLSQTARAIREGFGESEWAEIESDMNGKTISADADFDATPT